MRCLAGAATALTRLRTGSSGKHTTRRGLEMAFFPSIPSECDRSLLFQSSSPLGETFRQECAAVKVVWRGQRQEDFRPPAASGRSFEGKKVFLSARLFPCPSLFRSAESTWSRTATGPF